NTVADHPNARWQIAAGIGPDVRIVIDLHPRPRPVANTEVQSLLGDAELAHERQHAARVCSAAVTDAEFAEAKHRRCAAATADDRAFEVESAGFREARAGRKI